MDLIPLISWNSLNQKLVTIMRLLTAISATVFLTACATAAVKQPPVDTQASFSYPAVPERTTKARTFFDQLAPSYQRHFIGWIAFAKRPETKKKRVRESIALLAQGRKLGLK